MHLWIVPCQTLRGTGGDVVYLEEAAFIDDAVIYEVVLPLLQMTGTALIGISTPPDDPGNFYSSLFDMKEASGDPLFEKIEVTYSENAGADEVSPWKDASKMAMLKDVYAETRGDDYLREMTGARITSTGGVFQAADIQQLVDSRYALFR